MNDNIKLVDYGTYTCEEFEQFWNKVVNLEDDVFSIQSASSAIRHGLRVNEDYKAVWQCQQEIAKTADKFLNSDKEPVRLGLIDTHLSVVSPQPAVCYATFLGDEIIGFANLKLVLSHKLANGGGNVGYSILPKYRGLGYGKKQLKLLCEKAFNEFKMPSLIIDCGNEISAKTVEAVGGKFTNHVIHESNEFDRYIIFPEFINSKEE